MHFLSFCLCALNVYAFTEIRYGPMMGGPPPGPMPHNGPPNNYGGGPPRGGYHGGMGRDRSNGPPRFNDRGYQNDSGSWITCFVFKNSCFRHFSSCLQMITDKHYLLNMCTKYQIFQL